MTSRGAQSPVTVAFGRRVRLLRQEHGWTLRHAGTLAALDYTTLQRIEQGRDTSLGTADRISSVFGTPLAVMLSPDSCAHCHGAPHRGFTCQVCGAPGVPASAVLSGLAGGGSP